jgi:plastocyanin
MAANQLGRHDRPINAELGINIPSAIRRFGVRASVGVIAVVVIAGCSSSGSKSNAPAVSAAPSSARSQSTSTHATAMIMISSFKYTTPVTVSPGAMVSAMNMDGENHTVTADSANAFDDKANAGTTTMFKAPLTPGSYPYHCTYHSNMHGALVVK